jgi:hypothetical protein
MAKLTSAAWMVHDLGLATAIGGTVFGRRALAPALREVERAQGDRISEKAWRRFSWINLVAHGAMAATWFVGRSMVSGRSVSRNARKLVLVKDALVIASLVTGVTSVMLGRSLGKCIREEGSAEDHRNLERAVGLVGTANLVANAGVGIVTTALAMEGGRSFGFKYTSRRLP